MADISKFAAEYTKKKEAEEAAKPKSAFTHAQLLDALYWCWDAFDRAGMLFFPVFDTAKQMMQNDILRGNWLDIGVRELEWISGGKVILDAFMDHNRISSDAKGDLVEYIYNDVPVRVHIFKDDECLSNCDTIVYEAEHFRIPNPYKRFEALYNKKPVKQAEKVNNPAPLVQHA